MSILKNRLVKKFSTIPNEIIKDTSISHVAFRVYAYLVSKPENWQVYNNEVCKTLEIHEDTLSKAWKSLMAAGWIERSQQRDNNNQFIGGYEYTLYETIHVKPDTRKTRQSGNTVDEKHPDDNNKEELINKKECINTPTPRDLAGNVTIPDRMNNDSRLILGEQAYKCWRMIAQEIEYEFTEDEWHAIKGYCIAKPHLPPHEIKTLIVLLDKWANEGLDIIDTLLQSQSYRTIVKPRTKIINHAKTGLRLYGQELTEIRTKQILIEKQNKNMV